jgi:hypothetical protein
MNRGIVWSDLDMISHCTVKLGAHLVVGPRAPTATAT